MSNWYTSREHVKRALKLSGSERNAVIDDLIEDVSREVENLTARWFIPKVQTRKFNFPQKDNLKQFYVLYLDADLLSVDAGGLTANQGGKTISNFNLEPVNFGPPFNKIEIQINHAEFFSGIATFQQAVAVAGQWGYSNKTKAAGSVISGLSSDATVTSFVCSDASKIDVGDTLLVETEQLFVSERSTNDTGATLSADMTSDVSSVAVTVSNGALVNPGEVIQIDSEKMFVESVTGNVLTVDRAYDASKLAAHASSGSPKVYTFRTLTIDRGVNGTTAATHANATAASKYQVPGDVSGLTKALTIFYYESGQGGWSGAIGGADAMTEGRGINIGNLVGKVQRHYRRNTFEFV